MTDEIFNSIFLIFIGQFILYILALSFALLKRRRAGYTSYVKQPLFYLIKWAFSFLFFSNFSLFFFLLPNVIHVGHVLIYKNISA